MAEVPVVTGAVGQVTLEPRRVAGPLLVAAAIASPASPNGPAP